MDNSQNLKHTNKSVFKAFSFSSENKICKHPLFSTFACPTPPLVLDYLSAVWQGERERGGVSGHPCGVVWSVWLTRLPQGHVHRDRDARRSQPVPLF